MTSNYYYLVYFRVNNYHFKKVVLIYDDDIFEYLEKDTITKKELNDTINEFIYSDLDLYENMTNSEILADCNKTIDNYNRG